MKNFFNKVFNPSKTKWFFLYFIASIIFVIFGIILMPIWTNMGDWCFYKTWGTDMVNLIIAICIFIYLFAYLLPKIIKRTNGVIKVLTIIEFVLLTLIAIGSILQQFKIINVGGACQIFGLALWARGSVEIFRAYYHQNGNNEKYPVWWLVIAIAFTTLGAVLFVKPLFQDIVVLWIFVVTILLCGLLFFIYGFLTKPKSKKASTPKKVSSKKEASKK